MDQHFGNNWPFNVTEESRISTFLSGIIDTSDAGAIQAISANFVVQSVHQGAVLLTPGQRNDHVYVVMHGCLQLKMGETVHDIWQGEIAGTLDFLIGAHAQFTLTARRHSTVLRLDRLSFEQLIAEHSDLAKSLLRAIMLASDRLKSTSRSNRPPRTIAVIPLGGVPDHLEIVTELAQYRANLGGRTRILAEPDASQSTAAQIEAAERDVETLFLVADPTPTPWSRACVAHADITLLVADTTASSCERSEVEDQLLGPRGSNPDRDCMLVLLHPPDTISPTGTRHWLKSRSVRRHIHVKRGEERHVRRLARILAKQSVGVVLSGGGARGLAHVGALEALQEAGIEIDMIGGTSIGAVIGALHAMGKTGLALRQAVKKSFIDGGNPVGDFHGLPIISLARGARARKIVRAGILDATGTTIDLEDCWTNFFCVATNMTATHSTKLAHGPMEQAVLASFAIPGVMPPVVIDQHLFIDGGVTNNLPVDVMAEIGADRIIAVDVISTTIRPYPAEHIPSPWALAFDYLPWRRNKRRRVPGLMAIMHKASIIGSVSRQASQAAKADLVIRPQMRGVGLLTWKKMDIAVAAGRAATAERLASLDTGLFDPMKALSI